MKGEYVISALLTDEDKIFRDAIREFVETQLIPVRKQFDNEWRDPKTAHHLLKTLLVDLGLARAILPEEYGGAGLSSMVTAGIIFEELAREDAGFAVAAACTLWSLAPLVFGFRNEYILEWISELFSDNKLHLGCFAMTEPQGGSDIENVARMEGRTIRTKATLEGDEWVINGVKQWPTNSKADYYLTVATTDPELGKDGIALIMVPGDSEGISVSEPFHKCGMSADYNATIYFKDVRVPKEFRLAGPRRDADSFLLNLVVGCLGSAMISVGSARNVFEIVTKYASERVVGGKPLKEHSIAAGILAEMAMKIELARTYAMNIAYMFDHTNVKWSEELIAKARIAKVYSARMAIEVTSEAMHMMGSNGYSKDYEVEKHWRDVKETQIWLGGEMMNKLDIARYFCDLKQL